MLIRSPRSRRSSSAGRPNSSRSPNRTEPVTEAFPGSKPINAIASVVLPQPDSPTKPKTSPSWTVRETSLTADTVPSSVVKPTSTCARVSRSLTR